MVSNKKSYAMPQLIVHGNVEQLTQNKWGLGKVDALGSGLDGPYGAPGPGNPPGTAN